MTIWDVDENGVYEFTITSVMPDGTTIDTPGSLTVNADGSRVFDVPDPIVLPEPEPVPVDPDPVPFGSVFSLTGPDAVVFAIDETTGQVTINDWFAPDPGDNWDVDENGVYEFNIVATRAGRYGFIGAGKFDCERRWYA